MSTTAFTSFPHFPIPFSINWEWGHFSLWEEQVEKARWEFTAFPKLEALKAFEETETEMLVSDKDRLCRLQLCLHHALTQAGRRRNGVSKNPSPQIKSSQRSLHSAGLMFPMGLDKEDPSKRNCWLQAGGGFSGEKTSSPNVSCT